MATTSVTMVGGEPIPVFRRLPDLRHPLAADDECAP